jgi:hypothetical protein
MDKEEPVYAWKTNGDDCMSEQRRRARLMIAARRGDRKAWAELKKMGITHFQTKRVDLRAPNNSAVGFAQGTIILDEG